MDFIRNFLPGTVKDIDFTQINLDITDLSISDILRNLNKLYPPNSKNRYAIENGEFALGVLCKSETLEPYNGVFLLISKKELDINIASTNYIVLCISEERIRTEDSIIRLMDEITNYLIDEHYETMRTLPEFYKKFVYNEHELYDDDDDYNTESY